MKKAKDYYNFKSSDEEKRKLRIQNALLSRSLVTQQQKNTILEEENKKLRQEIIRIEQQKQKLEEELEKVKKQRDTYRGMVFKANRKQETPMFEKQQVRSIGGQTGHKGYGRKLPERIDKELRVFANCCPTCNGRLKRSRATLTHTVEDIPELQTQQTIVTKYVIERQWCTTCKKEITVTPLGVIPKSRLGCNLMLQVLIWKYVCRIPLNIIVPLLDITYSLHISEGTLVLFLKRASKYFGKSYQQILAEVRASPVKHADETGWRIAGKNNWCWAFLTKEAVYYTIEETRGKGIPEEIFKDCHQEDVLVRDDYPGYKKLPFVHQSCWAHLLRESHNEVRQETASQEMQELRHRLKQMYETLEKTVKKPFIEESRQRMHALLLEKIEAIIQTPYTNEDAKRVQYRIASQNKNLLTALLYDNVPLTNNLAERAIRPLVVTRKISGGSRSKEGANVHAINMSVMQTIRLKQQPLIKTLQKYLS